MADVTVDATALASLYFSDGVWGPYWTSPTTGYIIYQNAGIEIDIAKTADSGATWTIQDAANNPTGTFIRHVSVWFDKETPDNTGTILHIAFVRMDTTNTVNYIQFDTSGDTYGTERTVDSLTVAVNVVQLTGVTVSKSGRVYVCARGDFAADVEDTDHSMRSSSDGFAVNNESEGSPYSADEEVVKLYPGIAADGDDICAVVYDGVNQDLEFWKYDASVGTWGVTAVDATMAVTAAESRTYKGFFDAFIQHSDGAIVVMYWNDLQAATGDFRCVHIAQATPTITQKTNLDSNTTNSFFVGAFIDQTTDTWYTAYAGSDADDETMFVDTVVYYKSSIDSGGAWSTETAYGALADDIRIVAAGHSVTSVGGRFMPVFLNEDLDDILVNDGNDIEIAAAAVAATAIRSRGFYRGGIGRWTR